MNESSSWRALTEDAPGAPGTAPTWASSAKDTVGCSLGPARLWFTIGGGIVNKVYYPRADIPQIRDLGLIVADGKGFWIEVKRLGTHRIRAAALGVPALSIVHSHDRFELLLRICPDPARDVLLIEVALSGDEDLCPYVLLAPHLGGTGHGNHAEVAMHHGRRMLWAEQGPFALALAAADAQMHDACGRASAGYVGASDGWQNFAREGAMTWDHPRAGPGNVALIGELPRSAVLALGLASSKESAATLALSALMQPFDRPWQHQIDDWNAWHTRWRARSAPPVDLPQPLRDQYVTAAMVLRCHQDKTYPGAMVASLSVPWGNTRDERGGYHLIWPRDLVQCATALLALGAEHSAREILRYLMATQNEDGHWNQNQWLGGKPYWEGIQLDEAAFPVLLAAALAERGALDGIRVEDMVHRALSFIARTGPSSDQDRWEEEAGINAFTLAVCVAALVAGSGFLSPQARSFALLLADYWNAQIEEWTAVYDTLLAHQVGVTGYYVREAPPSVLEDPGAMRQMVRVKNQSGDRGVTADGLVSPDFLQLVRFGLRAADDPLIQDSVRVVDALLKTDTPSGPAWCRYNGDGYGEREDGSAFNGTGQGRPWPLLTGERGHYELAAGRDPLPFLQAMAAMSGGHGMLPEQVWDAPAIPARNLWPGRPTGSAMPLVWAHAEFIKLARSRDLGRAFDRPHSVWERYRGQRAGTQWTISCKHAPVRRLIRGTRLLVCLREPGIVRWSCDAWSSAKDALTTDPALGLHPAVLDVSALPKGHRVDLALFDAAHHAMDARTYTVTVD